ncbi:zinc-ribbon domain-containing protein [Bowmanella yangjiangensis]|uniref:Zinc ribbon domain-containing protein n=1 Tax=Bowmanella yangjiangensis TaxID=2811230 RepID=A0ABS3CYU6_9ALTE|nr:zinc-ribbon domain-containing protein [Bowmanella yangjiangensis]MBN7821561.1 zinc ribbon domain-containing protein [Bowmanella yangjiangensis]
MALTNCPSCNKKISDKAKSCQHCGFAVGAATEDDILRKQRFNKFKRAQSIQTQSMIAMLMFIAGFAILYWGDGPSTEYACKLSFNLINNSSPICLWHGQLQYNIAMSCSVIGFVWYVINRVRLIFMKKFD